MVTGDEVLLLPGWRGERRGLGVVGTVGEKLKRQERVCGPTLPQVDLDCVGFPLIVGVADRDEVEREAPDDALLREAAKVGRRLGREGVIGRFALDFVVTRTVTNRSMRRRISGSSQSSGGDGPVSPREASSNQMNSRLLARSAR